MVKWVCKRARVLVCISSEICRWWEVGCDCVMERVVVVVVVVVVECVCLIVDMGLEW